jgi:hypothetical protein
MMISLGNCSCALALGLVPLLLERADEALASVAHMSAPGAERGLGVARPDRRDDGAVLASEHGSVSLVVDPEVNGRVSTSRVSDSR